MDAVGLFEAKTKLSELVDRASRGDAITITRRGKPVARLVPLPEKQAAVQQELANTFREFRKSLKPATVDKIIKYKEEGRG